jgi:hypothetical protein
MGKTSMGGWGGDARHGDGRRDCGAGIDGCVARGGAGSGRFVAWRGEPGAVGLDRGGGRAG